MKRISEPEQQALLTLLAKHAGDLKKYAGVHYIDVGYRFRNNQPTPELAIRVHVFTKPPLPELAATEVLPTQIEGVPIDVIQSHPQPHQQKDRNIRFDPVPGGVAIASVKVNGMGTLGMNVMDTYSGAPMGLTASHVLVEDDAEPGDRVIQPATQKATDIVGNLVKWNTDLDCALFKYNYSREIAPGILGIPEIPREVKPPVIGMRLVKSGLTTGITHGVIDGVNDESFTIIPDQNLPEQEEEISAPGDSGAIWLEDGCYAAIGLHFAGEGDPDPAAERAWAKNLVDVFAVMNITLLPQES